MQDVSCGELLGVWMAAASNALRSGEIVRRVAQLHVRAEEQSIATRRAERHSNAARVHDANVRDRPVELHVSVVIGLSASVDR